MNKFTPIYRLAGGNITEPFLDRITMVRITDRAGIKSDTLEINLDDRHPGVAPPEEDSEITVSMGYKETGTAVMGIFIVDEVGFAGPEREMTVRARAADMVERLKAPRTTVWEDTIIADIVQEIANRHGYQAAVGGDVAQLEIKHLDQTEESDMHLLTRLAEDYGAVFKPIYKTLVFMPPGEAKSATGRLLPTVALVEKDLKRWNTTMAKRGKYQAVRARWRDIEKGEDVDVIVGSGDPEFLLRRTYPSYDLALAAAKAKYDALQRGVGTITLTTEGDARLGAEGKIEISGVRGANGTWVIEQAVHTISKKDGYVCDVEGAVPK